MKASPQNPYRTHVVTPPRRRMANRKCLITFITSVLLILTAVPQLKAQPFSNLGPSFYAAFLAHYFFAGTLTNNDGGADPIGALFFRPPPPVIPQFKKASPAGSPDAGGSGTIYGTASGGGTNGYGTVFALNLVNTNFTVLHSFTATADDANNNLTNSDGANPHARLLLSGNTLYGTTSRGGTGGAGTVFAVNTDGTGFTSLHSFTELDPLLLTNSDGVSPYAGLILAGSTLYGTTESGGANPNKGSSSGGTVFAIKTDGTSFTNLYSFTSGSDGGSPQGELLLCSNVLIGTANSGGETSLGDGGHGTLFGLNTNGTDFKG